MKTAHKTEAPSGSDLLTPDQLMFMGDLDMVRKHHVVDLPEFGRELNHSGYHTNFPLDRVEPGLYLDPAVITGAGEVTPPDRVSFTPQDLLGLGRDNSRHKVFFGQMALRWFKGNEFSQQVAVKPTHPRYAKEYQLGLQEVAMLQYLGKLGVHTFEPMGMLVSDTGKDMPDLFTITRFEPVTTMDNINWRSLTLHQRVLRAERAMGVAAIIHSNLVFHGDLETKNIALRQTGEPMVTDTEESVSAAALAANDDERSTERIFQLMSNDFSRIMHSLDVSINTGLPEEERLHGVERFNAQLSTFVSYYEHLVRTNSPYLAVLTPQVYRVFDRRYHEALGDI